MYYQDFLLRLVPLFAQKADRAKGLSMFPGGWDGTLLLLDCSFIFS